MHIDPTILWLFGVFVGVVAALPAGVKAGELLGRDTTARDLSPWLITRTAAAELDRARRVIAALADETARSSRLDLDGPGAEAILLHRLMASADVTADDLRHLHDGLRDLASLEGPRPDQFIGSKDDR
jgi:hypothetical protein